MVRPIACVLLVVILWPSAHEATLADCLWMPTDADGPYRKAAAHHLAVGMKLADAAKARFGEQETDRICYWARVIQPNSIRDYMNQEWYTPDEYPKLAF